MGKFSLLVAVCLLGCVWMTSARYIPQDVKAELAFDYFLLMVKEGKGQLDAADFRLSDDISLSDTKYEEKKRRSADSDDDSDNETDDDSNTDDSSDSGDDSNDDSDDVSDTDDSSGSDSEDGGVVA